jgi:hypothetical protein
MEKLCRKLPPNTKLSTGVYTACTYGTYIRRTMSIEQVSFQKRKKEKEASPHPS